MAKATKVKHVNFALSRGVRIHGVSVFPTQPGKGNAKPAKTVIRITEQMANEFHRASKGEITKDKVNATTPKPAATEDDGLSAALGEDSGSE